MFSMQKDGPATLLKKRLWHRCFLVNFVKFVATLFFIEHLWWLLLVFRYCYTERETDLEESKSKY